MTAAKKPTLAGLILGSSPRLLWSSVGLSLVAGACYSLIIPFLMQGIGPGATPGNAASWAGIDYGLVFFALCLITFVAKVGSLVLVTYLVKDLAADMRIRLCRRISRAGVPCSPQTNMRTARAAATSL